MCMYLELLSKIKQNFPLCTLITPKFQVNPTMYVFIFEVIFVVVILKKKILEKLLVVIN